MHLRQEALTHPQQGEIAVETSLTRVQGAGWLSWYARWLKRGHAIIQVQVAAQARKLAWRMGSSFSLGFLGMKEVQSAMTSGRKHNLHMPVNLHREPEGSSTTTS